MKIHTILTILLFTFVSCTPNNYQSVGDIPYDPAIDDISFKICDESNIKQYYVRNSLDTPPLYSIGKRGLERFILEQYQFPPNAAASGYLTIRFIVNCQGKMGRFRMKQMDFNYQNTEFAFEITDQLLRIVKDLDDWIPRKGKHKSYDFYQYLTFKIENGQITQILP